MIRKIVKKETTKQSHPQGRAELKCNFSDIGYIEEEYFMYGTANIYEDGENNSAKVIYEDAEYANRFTVRKPKDISKFSGNVVIEILNATAMVDLDRMWVNTWKYFTRNGDVFIGITSKSDVLCSLYNFDAERYKEISWKNPLPDRKIPENQHFKIFSEYEAGLFWDMLTDLAKLLRKNDPMNPILEYRDIYLYLTGWSQSTLYINRYIKSFAYLKKNCKNGPMFDGYLSAGGGYTFAALNSFEPVKIGRNFFALDGAGVIECSEPFVSVNTESENALVNWVGDSDEPGKLFRIYEIAGGSHDTKNNILNYYNNDPDLAKAKVKPSFEGEEEYPNDYPYEYCFNTAFRNLYYWVREGMPAPHADRIPVDVNGENVKDAFGNAVGGVRTPAIDYPVAKYAPYCTLKNGGRGLFGYCKPFSSETLMTLYGSLDNYRELVEKNIERTISLGFILEEDKKNCIEQIVKMAKNRGLR